ncbi:hypothetical protein F5B19DRAFT_491073 [Rostrohypoxylon terebratum]|nr:hypothetical protein F5B19DRAFT_491073 [Rostrohypoxylon terebratum]
MAEGSSSYDKVDHMRDRLDDWEAISPREADRKRSEDDESQLEPKVNDHRRSCIRANGESAEPDGRQKLSIKTLGSVARPSLSASELQDGDRDECKAPRITLLMQELTTTNSSIYKVPGPRVSGASAFEVESPISPVSSTDVSKPTVRFSDRGPPRASAKRPSVSRRSSSNVIPMAEWGVLFDERDYATHRCSQFLKGLARHIIDDLTPGSSNLVITPEKLGLFYSKYRIDQEVYYFVDIFDSRTRDVHERIADFFTDLDCQYHLVQLDSYSRPRVPALTPLGFAQYLTTCILAHPDEEFRRLAKIVADVQLVADSDGQLERLPRQLLRSQFPVRHDSKSRKILEAALDDLMYDLGLLGTTRPKTQAPLAIMPPPPPPISENRGSGSTVGVRQYAPPEKPLSAKETYAQLAGRYMPAGALQTIGDEAASASESMSRYREDARRNSYHERPLIRYVDEPSSHEYAPPSQTKDRQYTHTPQRQNSLEPRPTSRFSSPRTSQTGTLTIAPTTTTRTYRTTAYTPQKAGTGTSTPTYRRAQSPPLRTYRASAPDVSGSSSSSSNGFKPAGYHPSSDRRASVPTPTDRRREYAASLSSAPTDTTYPSSRSSLESDRRRGSSSGAGPASSLSPSTTTTALVPSHSGSQYHVRQESGGSRRTTTAPPSPGPGSERKHHSHRRSAVVKVDDDDDRGPTWEEVLKGQPAAPHQHRSGTSSSSSSSKGGSGHHHRRHHSGYY